MAARRTRWWPLLLIALVWVGVVSFAWTLLEADQRQVRVLTTLITSLVCLLFAGLWLLLLSGLPRGVRLGALAAALVLVAAGAGAFELRGVSGDFVPDVRWRWSASGAVGGSGPTAESTEAPDALAELATADYPRFQGPGGDAMLEGPALADWTEARPRLIWRRSLGAAWSSFAVAGQRAVTMAQRGDEEAVVCLDLRTGRERWRHAYAARYSTAIAGTGPRATPTIDGDAVFAMGATGVVTCLELATGAARWSVDALALAGAARVKWGQSSSPLVDGDRVIVSAGGPDGWSLVALDRTTGAVRWHAGDAAAAYGSPQRRTLAGRAQVVVFNARQVASHDPETGAILWTYPWRAAECVSQPLPVGEDRLLVSSGYGAGGELLRVRATGDRLAAERLWRARRLRAKFSNVVRAGDHVYTLSDGRLCCFAVATGERAWRGPRYGHGQLILVGRKLIVQAETGAVVLVAADPAGPRELGRIEAFDAKTWNPPAFAAPLLLVRNDREAACYRLPLAR